MAKTINDVLFPKVGGSSETGAIDKANLKKNSEASDFDKALSGTKEKEEGGLKFSSHAMKRLEDRSIKMDSDEFLKLRGALDKLKTKGGKDSLVLTGKAAYIMDVPNSTIVTAMDKSKLGENVFTKIDSTLILE